MSRVLLNAQFKGDKENLGFRSKGVSRNSSFSERNSRSNTPSIHTHRLSDISVAANSNLPSLPPCGKRLLNSKPPLSKIQSHKSARPLIPEESEKPTRPKTQRTATIDTPVVTYSSERLQWSKRLLPTMPVLVMNFEGVLGDYFKSSAWEANGESLFLRSAWDRGLRILQECFYLVLFCSLKPTRAQELLQFFRKKGFVFDAVYRTTTPNCFQNYSQVAEDFKLQDSSSVLVVSSLNLDEKEITARKGKDLLSDNSVSKHKRLRVKGCPEGSCKPLTVLVSNPRAQNFNKAMALDSIARVIYKFYKNSVKSACFLETFSEAKQLDFPGCKFVKVTDSEFLEGLCFFVISSKGFLVHPYEKVLTKQSTTFFDIFSSKTVRNSKSACKY